MHASSIFSHQAKIRFPHEQLEELPTKKTMTLRSAIWLEFPLRNFTQAAEESGIQKS